MLPIARGYEQESFCGKCTTMNLLSFQYFADGFVRGVDNKGEFERWWRHSHPDGNRNRGGRAQGAAIRQGFGVQRQFKIALAEVVKREDSLLVGGGDRKSV